MSRTLRAPKSKSPDQRTSRKSPLGNRKTLGVSASADLTPARKSSPLTRPLHVRLAASSLYNRCLKRWDNEKISANQTRALVSALALTRTAIFDTTLEKRMTAIEQRLGIETDPIAEPEEVPEPEDVKDVKPS